jgi:hypothetical protein
MARASVSKPDKMVNFTTLTCQFVIKMRQNRRKNAPLKNSALSTFDRNVLASAQLTSTKSSLALPLLTRAREAT